MKNTTSVIMITLLLTVMFAFTFCIQPARTEPRTITVPYDYDTIQEAVDAAGPGDTIFVKTGTYPEHVVVNKNGLTLVGEDRETTIINGSGSGTVLYVGANNTVVKSFTIQNSGGWLPDSGIFLDRALNCSVWGNTIVCNYAGIRLYKSSICNVLGNVASNNSCGFWIEQSSKCSVLGNTAFDNDVGIRLYDSSNCTVFGNSAGNNSQYGIWLYDSSDNVVSGNNLASNKFGIELYSSSRNTISRNNFINNINQTILHLSSGNFWNESYSVGGNYWSDYEERYPNATEIDDSGIWDTPYSIDENNQDNYPLMSPYTSPVHNLNTALDYPTIQEAIDARETSGGHTIAVDAGTYPENVLVYKSLTLIGEDRDTTIIDGGGDALKIVANNTFVTNFTLQNSNVGIYVSICGNATIQNNKVTDNSYGIFMGSSYFCVLRNNNIFGNSYNFGIGGVTLQHYIHDIDDSNVVDGNPVYYLVNQTGLIINSTLYPSIGYMALISCTQITVENLTLTGNGQGVLFAYTKNSTIKNITATSNSEGVVLYSSSNCSVSGNVATNNGADGISLYSSSNCSVSGNVATNNGADGIYLLGSSYDDVFNNNVSGNMWGSALFLRNSHYNNVAGNNASGGGIGISLYDSQNNSFVQNTIANNKDNFGFGIFVWNSSGNFIYYNSFINNKFQVVSVDSVNTWNRPYPYGGNNWSDYAGKDELWGDAQHWIGSDGIGDTRYTKWGIVDYYPLMKPYGGPYDIGITNITFSKTIIAQGYNYNLNMKVKIINYGETAATFNITVYSNSTPIATKTSITLPSRRSKEETFAWNTTGLETCSNFTINANATAVTGETYTADNTFVDRWVKVVTPGNVNGDQIVDMKDITTILRAYGSTPSHVKWLPSHPRDEWYVNCYANSDVNCDGIVDMKDITIAIRNYGKTC